MATDKEVLEAAANNAAYILKLEAENEALREAAQAVVTQYRCKGSIWKQMDALAALLEER